MLSQQCNRPYVRSIAQFHGITLQFPQDSFIRNARSAGRASCSMSILQSVGLMIGEISVNPLVNDLSAFISNPGYVRNLHPASKQPYCFKTQKDAFIENRLHGFLQSYFVMMAK